MSHTFWKYGLVIHGSLISLIALAAYVGMLPQALNVIPHYDLAGHFFLVGFFAFFLDGTLHFRPLVSGKYESLRLAPVIVFCFAAIEETLQTFSPYRTACLSDFFANSIGIFLCSWLAKWLDERSRQHTNYSKRNQSRRVA